MQDIIVLVIIVLIVGFALRKVIRDRKRGYTCLSCPQSGNDDCKCE
jgi:hypothetical protein